MLQSDWNTLRIPPDPTWLSLTERPGHLRLRGMESMSSTHRQSMVARRLQAFACEAETCLEFAPDHPQQMAGLILYYDTKDYLYLRVTYHEEKGLCLGIIQSKYGVYDELLEDIPLKSVNGIRLKVVVDHDRACFTMRYRMIHPGIGQADGSISRICPMNLLNISGLREPTSVFASRILAGPGNRLILITSYTKRRTAQRSKPILISSPVYRFLASCLAVLTRRRGRFVRSTYLCEVCAATEYARLWNR